MKKIYTLLGVIGLIAFSSTSIAQCPNDNTQWLTSSAPTSSTPTTLTSCIYGGEYRLVTNMQAGAVYTFQTCGFSAFDTEITIYNDATGAFIVENDDFCGLQSSVTFTSDGSDVRVLVDQWPCNSNTTCMTLQGSVAAPAVDPCDDITDLVGCGVSKDFSLSGSGSYNGNGPWSTPGEEVIYSYTAPYSGDFEISISHPSSGWVDLFYREASSGCSGSGWTYVDDILTTATNDVFLVGGVTYYFMIDDESTTTSTGTITIDCPCIPSSSPDGTYTYNGDFTINGSTNGECNDCSLRPSDDQIHEIVIPCPGTYTFETCNLATWDTYLYLSTSFCGGVIASNDDACGLRSSITSYLLPGTYYVTVEAWSSSASGDYGLSVSGVIDAVNANITPQNHVIDCVPIPVDLTANVTGGTGPYTYLWSDGSTGPSITVNPNVTTSYSVTVTDANNCSVDMDNTTVEVINRCGNNNEKSLICHVPSGNTGNPQTICISPNALNAHLATLWDLHGGDYCGPCASNSALVTTDNTNLGDNSFIRAGVNVNTESVDVSYRLAYDTEIRVEIYDMAGVLVDVIYEGQANEGELYELHLQSDKMSSGVYIYQFITDRETHIDKLQIIQ